MACIKIDCKLFGQELTVKCDFCWICIEMSEMDPSLNTCPLWLYISMALLAESCQKVYCYGIGSTFIIYAFLHCNGPKITMGRLLMWNCMAVYWKKDSFIAQTAFIIKQRKINGHFHLVLAPCMSIPRWVDERIHPCDVFIPTCNSFYFDVYLIFIWKILCILFSSVNW